MPAPTYRRIQSRFAQNHRDEFCFKRNRYEHLRGIEVPRGHLTGSISGACSSTCTDSPSRRHAIAHVSPPMPAPMIQTRRLLGLVTCILPLCFTFSFLAWYYMDWLWLCSRFDVYAVRSFFHATGAA